VKLKVAHRNCPETAFVPPAPSRSRRAALRRIMRYGSVSVVSTITSLTILGALVGGFGFPALWSNVVATAVGTIPSFELNRRWVWAQTKQRSLLRQAVPYCALSFLGLIASSIAVRLAAEATSGSTRLIHTVAVECANLGTYGALWLLQFVLCDRVLFPAEANASKRDTRTRPEGPLDATGAVQSSALTR
jgi:putative flippase GtrA